MQPTRARYVVLFFLCTMSFVLYLDRICFGQAIPSITNELGLSNAQMSWVATAFSLAYGLFEVPVGRWGDRFGSRRTLARIVLFWSLFTALTGTAQGFLSLLAIRFLFGLGEAGAFPNAARITATWFPPEQRGRYRGFMLACSLLGGTAAPALSAWIIDRAGWRWNFAIFGAVGILWTAAFFWWFRDTPAEHTGVNDAERAVIGPPTHASAGHEPIPWRFILTSRNVMLMTGVIIFSAFITYFFFVWYPSYLRIARGVSQQQAGNLTSLVLAGTTVGTFLGGVAADFFRTPAGRQWYCAGSAALGALLFVAGINTESPEAMSGLFALATLSLASFQAIWWGFCAELGGRHVGALFGFMNGMGGLGAILTQQFYGQYADWRKAQGYEGREAVDLALWVCVGSMACASLCWASMNARGLRGEAALTPFPTSPESPTQGASQLP